MIGVRSFIKEKNSLVPSCLRWNASWRTQVRIVLLCLLTLASSDGSAATLAKAKRLTHFYSVALLPGKWFACFPSSGDGLILAYTGQNINTRILCQILHSTPYFFISLFPTAFFLRSRMTGRYLVTFRKKLFFRFCSHLPLPTACVLHFIVLWQ